MERKKIVNIALSFIAVTHIDSWRVKSSLSILVSLELIRDIGGTAAFFTVMTFHGLKLKSVIHQISIFNFLFYLGFVGISRRCGSMTNQGSSHLAPHGPNPVAQTVKCLPSVLDIMGSRPNVDLVPLGCLFSQRAQCGLTICGSRSVCMVALRSCVLEKNDVWNWKQLLSFKITISIRLLRQVYLVLHPIGGAWENSCLQKKMQASQAGVWTLSVR